MRVKENQETRVSGRYELNQLPESDIKTFLMGQKLHLLSIQTSYTADFSSFFRSEFSQNLVTYQKIRGCKTNYE